MKIFSKYIFIFVFSLMIIPAACADENISIQTKPVYYYGEFLSFSVNVQEVTGDLATFRIIDSNQKPSSPINLEIKNKTTTVTAPFPFESAIFSEGKYTIELQYSGKKTSVEFSIMDSGKKLIPHVTIQVSNGWVDGLISDYEYTKFLLDQKVINMSDENLDATVKIPSWVKITTKWWADGLIADQDYIDGLQFLVNRGIINSASSF